MPLRWWSNSTSYKSLMVQLKAHGRYTPVVFTAIVLFMVLALYMQMSPSDNVLSIRDISASHGVIREQRMFNGITPDMNYPVDDFTAAIFLAEDSFVVFDLRKPEDIRHLQLDSYQDNFVIWTSLDGLTFTPVATKRSVIAGSVVNYYSEEKELRARYIKLTMTPGSKSGAAFELVALRERPAGVPLTFKVQSPPTYQSALDADLHRLKIVRLIKVFACVVIIILLSIVQSKAYAVPAYIYAIIFAFGFFSFVMFQGPIVKLHPWEIAHYYIGAKYHKELTYKDMYRELARNEIMHGRGTMIQRLGMMDLETYERIPGSRISGEVLSSPSKLSSSRSAQLSRDVDNIRTLFDYGHYQRIFRDHGYNGSPLYTTVFGSLFNSFPASHSFFSVMAFLDLLLLFGGLTLIWFAFGPLAGAVSSLIIGLGEPWSFLWTGGSLGRYIWFFLFCLGFAIIKKNDRLKSVPIICVSGLLRMFPFVFVLGIGLSSVFNFLKNKAAVANYKWIFGAFVVLVIGLAIPVLVHNFDIYPQFAEKMRLHAQNRSVNRIALDYLLNNELLTSHENVKKAALLVKFVFLGGYLFLLYLLSKARLSAWHSLVASGILVFAFVPLSSYDYIWIVCLAPVILSSKVRTAALFLALGASNYFTDTFMQKGHLYTNFVFSAFIIVFYVSYLHDVMRHPEKLEYV